jgi:hypothetical protein
MSAAIPQKAVRLAVMKSYGRPYQYLTEPSRRLMTPAPQDAPDIETHPKPSPESGLELPKPQSTDEKIDDVKNGESDVIKGGGAKEAKTEAKPEEKKHLEEASRFNKGIT